MKQLCSIFNLSTATFSCSLLRTMGKNHRIKTNFLTLTSLGLTLGMAAQEQETDSLEGTQVVLDEVFVQAVRVNKKTPVTFSNLQKEDIAPRNLGQDIPVLLNYLPGVVTTTDAGAGVGYTGIRVRGSDATRVNVTINGVPYNDSESQGTFWVNMPDFASSTESLQLQRGVGTSTNGAGAFGASLNLLTDAVSQEAYGQISSSLGSFNTLRNNIKFSTGLLNDHVEISGRLSRISSDGYVDRASSDLESYFLQAAYSDENTLIKALIFGGKEITYQAWNGIDAQTLQEDRTYNSAGKYTDEEGNIRFYDNEIDNYKQDHAQLLWNEQLSNAWSTNIAFHFTHGRGYFEQYKEDRDFAAYGLKPLVFGDSVVNSTDLIRRKWLDNDFYGTVFSANYTKNNVDLILGGGANRYEGAHFGEIIWARFASDAEIRDRYYDDDSKKTDFNLYAKVDYGLTEKLRLYADFQYRTIGYKTQGEETGEIDDQFDFFNPKAGVVYDLNPNNNFYFSYAMAHREPNRDDYKNGSPKSEKLNDLELGWRYVSPDFQLNVNTYYMGYKDQLVLTGDIDDTGDYIRANVDKSYRAGLEMDANLRLWNKLTLRPNIAFSTNKIEDFVLTRDGTVQNLGDTHIAFSPGIVAGNAISYSPSERLAISLLSKYVGEQYLSNTDTEASKLKDYFVNDLNLTYGIIPGKLVKSIEFSALVNNVFDVEYVSNGYTYLDTFSNPGNSMEVQGYYPQAGINFLLGATLRF